MPRPPPRGRPGHPLVAAAASAASVRIAGESDRGEAAAVEPARKRPGATGPRWGRGIRGPAAGLGCPGRGCVAACSGDVRASGQRRISAMTSPYSVSPTGVKPTRWKNSSGPPSPASYMTFDAVHAALARLFDELLDREAADAATLVVGVDVDAPQHRPEVLLRRLGVEVRADEADDLVRRRARRAATTSAG